MSRQFSRRNFLQGCSYAIASMAGARLSNLAFSAQDNPTDTLVVVFLRGAWDALNVIPPVDGDDRGLYEKARPDIKIPAETLLRLNDQFGMHPALAPLFDLYQQGKMAVVHAAGLTVDTRSHFDAMEFIELGTPGVKNTANGWITRHLQSTPHGSTGLLPAISTSGMPTSLMNYTPAVSMTEPGEFSQWDNGTVLQQQAALRKMYAGNTLLDQVGRRTLDALDLIAPLVGEDYAPSNGASYNDDDLGRQLKTVARMIKLNAGLQVATVDFGGWDTHEYQNDRESGYMGDLLGALGSGLANFYLDLDSGYTERLSVVVLSEFGRRLVQNDSYGTDHGHGSVMLTLGGAVNGGQVLGQWPGLGNEQLYDHADLAVTTDYRQVLSELLTTRLGNPNIETIFPGFRGYTPPGVFHG